MPGVRIWSMPGTHMTHSRPTHRKARPMAVKRAGPPDARAWTGQGAGAARRASALQLRRTRRCPREFMRSTKVLRPITTWTTHAL